MRISAQQQVINKYEATSKDVQEYFGELPDLLELENWEIALAYTFMLLERGYNRVLYCGVVKLHCAHKDVAQSIIDKQQITRKNYPELYENVMGHSIPPELLSELKAAERVRDRVVHGKKVERGDMRKAIIGILDYAEKTNEIIAKTDKSLRPFRRSLVGFKGTAQPLDKKTTSWLLKGLGFQVG